MEFLGANLSACTAQPATHTYSTPLPKKWAPVRRSQLFPSYLPFLQFSTGLTCTQGFFPPCYDLGEQQGRMGKHKPARWLCNQRVALSGAFASSKWTCIINHSHALMLLGKQLIIINIITRLFRKERQGANKAKNDACGVLVADLATAC